MTNVNTHIPCSAITKSTAGSPLETAEPPLAPWAGPWIHLPRRGHGTVGDRKEYDFKASEKRTVVRRYNFR